MHNVICIMTIDQLSIVTPDMAPPRTTKNNSNQGIEAILLGVGYA